MIYLASASPRRRELLAKLGLEFTVIKSQAEPEISGGKINEPAALVCELSRLKAEGAAPAVSRGIIIGADTVVFLEGRVMGKPASEEEAFMMLKKLNGRMHEVYTGVTLLDKGKGLRLTEYEKTRVYFRNLSEKALQGYINTGEPMDKAGAYGIQGLGAVLVEKIEGCYFNVVGLPLARLAQMLAKVGVHLLGEED